MNKEGKDSCQLDGTITWTVLTGGSFSNCNLAVTGYTKLGKK